MQRPLLTTVVAALALPLCAVSASDLLPHPKCDYKNNWYSCHREPDGLILCDLNVVHDTAGPLAVRWTSPHYYDLKYKAGDSDFSVYFTCSTDPIKLIIHCSLKLCFPDGTAWTGDGPRWSAPPCKVSWYNCELLPYSTHCQLSICPIKNTPLVPKSGKDKDWYTCKGTGTDAECYLSNKTVKKDYTDFGHLSKHP